MDVEPKALKDETQNWLGHWLSEIRPWTPNDVDNERLIWMRCYGIPCHAWSHGFFEFLTCLVGVYIYSDNETRSQERMYVAKSLIRTK